MKVSMHNKQARREGAKRRFKILSKTEWIKANGKKNKTTPLGDGAYDAYVARKQIELNALGLF